MTVPLCHYRQKHFGSKYGSAEPPSKQAKLWTVNSKRSFPWRSLSCVGYQQTYLSNNYWHPRSISSVLPSVPSLQIEDALQLSNNFSKASPTAVTLSLSPDREHYHSPHNILSRKGCCFCCYAHSAAISSAVYPYTRDLLHMVISVQVSRLVWQE